MFKKEFTLDRPWRKEDIRYDKNKVYVPLYKVMKDIIEKTEVFDLDVPIAKIAWMILHGTFPEKRHKPLVDDIYELLRKGNKYRKLYFKLKEKCESYFDKLMKRHGYYAPQIMEYKYLKLDFYKPVMFEKERGAWLMSYRNREDKLRERAEKSGRKIWGPEKLIEKAGDKYGSKIKKLEEARDDFLQEARTMLSKLDHAKKRPEKPWVHWEAEDDGS